MAAPHQLVFTVRPAEGGMPFELAPAAAGAETDTEHVIGRDSTCTLRLPDQRVSRRHAALRLVDGHWQVSDLGSRSGTLVNGRRLNAEEWHTIQPGTVLTIGPFELRLKGEPSQRPSISIHDDRGAASAIAAAELGSLAARRLELLVQLSGKLHMAAEASEALDHVADALMHGTGYARVLFLRHSPAACDPLTQRVRHARAQDAPLSRTLLQAAYTSRAAVRLEDRLDLRGAASLLQGAVTSAICIPVTAATDDPLSAQTVAYLDSPGGGAVADDAIPFACAACQLAELALHSAERRALEADVSAMHQVQLQLMPPDRLELPGLVAHTRCVPGRGAAGDVVGVCRQPDGGALILVGDVSGKGPAAAMLMAAAVSAMDASLTAGATPQQALQHLNTHIVDRFQGTRFVTAICLHATPDGQLHVCDAGHGLSIHLAPDREPTVPSLPGGPPLGAVPGMEYEWTTFPLKAGERFMIVTDGVTEQADPHGQMFGMERALQAVQHAPEPPHDAAAILDALRAHARSSTFTDDVTIVSVGRV